MVNKRRQNDEETNRRNERLIGKPIKDRYNGSMALGVPPNQSLHIKRGQKVSLGESTISLCIMKTFIVN